MARLISGKDRDVNQSVIRSKFSIEDESTRRCIEVAACWSLL